MECVTLRAAEHRLSQLPHTPSERLSFLFLPPLCRTPLRPFGWTCPASSLYLPPPSIPSTPKKPQTGFARLNRPKKQQYSPSIPCTETRGAAGLSQLQSITTPSSRFPVRASLQSRTAPTTTRHMNPTSRPRKWTLSGPPRVAKLEATTLLHPALLGID